MDQRQTQGEQGLLSKQVTAELAAIGKQRFQDFVSAQDEVLFGSSTRSGSIDCARTPIWPRGSPSQSSALEASVFVA